MAAKLSLSCARKTARALSGALAATMLLALAFTAPALAQSAIKVLVNDEPITSYDIRERGKMLRIFTGGKQGEKQAVDQLIEERLMLQEAKLRSVEVTDAELDAEIENRARSAKLTAAQFLQALRQAGVDPETFKDFLRANVAWTQVVRARFRATINVTDQDVTAALTARAPAEPADPTAEDQTVFEYKLQPIIFILPAGASAGTETARRKEANAFRGAFQGCSQSLTQAAGISGVVVKPEVRREESQLPPALKEALASLEVGGITEPEKVEEGIQILGVCAKTTIAGQTEATVETRQELSTERGKLLARRYLRDLRADAVIEYR
jgi:peptidyl-prolyl cis-trans isomerase SurA